MASSARGLSGGAKRCTLGKSCGATCIDARERCNLELGPHVSESLEKVADKILNRAVVLQTPEKAVAFFEKNKDRLVTSGIGDWGDPEADTVIVGIEPGFAPKEYFNKDGKLPARLSRVQEAAFPDKPEEWYGKHPMVFANDARQAYLLQRAGADRNQQQKFLYPEKEQEIFNRDWWKENLNWRPFNRKLLAIADGVGGSTYQGVNVSPFGFPSERVWPFKNLPFAKDSVYKDRESWLKYAAKLKAKQIADSVARGDVDRKLVYVGSVKPMYRQMFGDMAKQLGQSPQTKTLTWESAAGKKMKVDVTYFVVEKNGKKTVFMNANHPSWTGYGNEAIGQMQKFLNEISS